MKTKEEIEEEIKELELELLDLESYLDYDSVIMRAQIITAIHFLSWVIR